MPLALTATGLQIQTEQEIFDERVATLRAAISPSLSFAPDTPEGQLVGEEAARERLLQELLLATLAALGTRAEGLFLDAVAALTGTERRDPAPSTVTAQVDLDAGTYAAGTIRVHVLGDPDAVFSNVAEVSEGSDGVFNVEMESEDTGPIQAPAGTLTEIVGSIVGVNSVTNALDATPGANIEDDALLRIRRRAELGGQGSGRVQTIRANLTQTKGVLSAEVIENDTGDVLNGLPPHTMEAVVLGGTDDDIATTIWAHKPGGIAMVGSETGQAIDSQGNTRLISFSRPLEKQAFLEFDIEVDPSAYPLDGDQQVANAVAAFTDGSLTVETAEGVVVSGQMRVGTDLFLSAQYTAIFTVPGVKRVVAARAGFSVSPAGTDDLVVLGREVIAVNSDPGVQSADIVVNSSVLNEV